MQMLTFLKMIDWYFCHGNRKLILLTIVSLQRQLSSLWKEYDCDFVIDARNGFEDDKADVCWGFAYLLPQMSKTGCENVWFIMNDASADYLKNEMNMWEREFSKYFTVRRSESLERIKGTDQYGNIVYKDTHDFSAEELKKAVPFR